MPLKDGFPMHRCEYEYWDCEIDVNADPVKIRYSYRCPICGDILVREEISDRCCCRIQGEKR